MVIMYVTAVVAVSLVSVSGSAVLRRTQPVPSGPQRIAGERLYQGSKPIDKRVNWFISDSVAALPATTKYLLEDNRAITQGVYFCCGGLSFSASTGEPALGTFDPAVIKAFSDAGVATIMPTFGGDALPYAAWCALRARRASTTHALPLGQREIHYFSSPSLAAGFTGMTACSELLVPLLLTNDRPAT